MVSFAERKELAEGLRGVFAAPSRELALRGAAEELADRWRGSHPKVTELLEEHVEEECLSCLAFPESHRRRRIRTTNALERFNLKR
jgi:transposase-like protein